MMANSSYGDFPMPPIQPVRAQVIEKIAYLQDSDLAELLKFIEFLQWRSRCVVNPVLANAGVLSGEPMSATEIEAILYGN
jgi:hypothetical protein